MLHQLQQTATLLLFAIMAGMIWLLPKERAISERQHFYDLWWSEHLKPLHINRMDSLFIATLPLSPAAQSAFQFRRRRHWPVTNEEELRGLPGIDSFWVQSGTFDFSADPAPSSSSSKINTRSINAASPKKRISTLDLKIDINEADSLTLMTIPGVGSWGAHAILRERQRWGSIRTLNQLKHSFPFDRRWEENWTEIMVIRPQTPNWSLNQSSFDSLLQIPVFNYHQVKRIAFYRESFDSIHWDEIQTWGWWNEEEIDFFKLYISE